MKKTLTESFRDYDGFDYGAGRIRIVYLPVEEIRIKYKSITAKSGYDWDAGEINLAIGLDDRTTLLCLFHEMRHVAMEDQTLTKYISTEDDEETIMDAMAMFDSEVAHRNPAFWRSLSLEG